ncbi:MAG: P-loop NTPase [Coriobacteriia bacterium]|nr:P-loop NTPase [Coriobacteriia bacterium]
MSFQNHALQDTELVAYGFLSEADSCTQLMHNKYIQLFHSAYDARRVLACASSEVQVVVCDRSNKAQSGDAEVSPLNLVAALCRDNPLRDIYMEKLQPERLFISRAQAAGARGVINSEEAERLLGVPAIVVEPATALPPVSISPVACPASSAPPVSPAPSVCPVLNTCSASTAPFDLAHSEANKPSIVLPDIAWLEQVLELEELDEAPLRAGQALLEREPILSAESIQLHKPSPTPQAADKPEDTDGAIVAAFVSGRGGVGKSSLTVLTAFELWKMGSRVVMLDLDLQFGDISVLAGNEPESRIQRLTIEQLCENRMSVPVLDEALLLLEAPARPEAAEELVSQIPQLLDALRAVSDIVLINTSCLWNEAAAVLASRVDKIVICMDQRATSISAARQVVDLCVRLQVPSTQLYYLLNRSARNAAITSIDASLAMGGVEVMTIAEGGSDIDELLSLGCPLEALSAQSALRQSVHDLGICLLTQPGAGIGFRGERR